MKKIIFTLIFLLVGFAFAAGDQKVTVSGLAKEKKAVNEAFKDALSNAFVNAVEKNIGTWLKSQSSSIDLTAGDKLSQAKFNILSSAADYVSDYRVVKRGLSAKGYYEVLVEVTISTDRLAGEIRKYVSAVKESMDNPSIAFVLTSWEKKGVFTTVSAKGNLSTKSSYSGSEKSSDYAYDEASVDGSASAKASRSGAASQNVSASAKRRVSGSGSAEMNGYSDENTASYQGRYEGENSGEYSGSARGDYSASESADVSYNANARSSKRSDRARSAEGQGQSNASVEASLTTGKIDETVYAKFADMGIIDGFQQEFKEKGFDLMAADKAREIAVAPSAYQTGIDINDRSAVRNFAEKEGANFVARGEIMLLDQSRSASTGQPEVTGKISVEIIDVNSGDVVASYMNTVTASNSNVSKARAQVIKKSAVVAAKTLASQTLQTWQERADKGRQYAIEIRNVKKARSQKIPFEKALSSIAKISSQTSPSAGVQLYKVLYKGNKSQLGMAIIEALGDAKGFSEDEFDGPNDENGKIVFVFTK